ncbi:MAG: type IV secretory system conjugative DNA transfer family protein [Ktedonobacteraceae bacterium]
MGYDYHSRYQNQSSDPFVEIPWKVFIVLLCVLGAPLLLIGHVGSRQIEKHFPHHQRLIWTMLVVLTAVCVFVGYRLFWPLNGPGTPLIVLLTDVAHGIYHHWQFDYPRLLYELLPVWAMELLLSPLSLMLFGIHNQSRPKSSAQLARVRSQQKDAVTQQARKAAVRTLQKKAVPDAITLRQGEPSLVLGAPIEGTLLDWIKHHLFTLPFEELIRHAVVIGASGSGKSETLLRIAIAAAKALGWQVIYIDAKGDYKAAAKFLLLMQEADITNVRMFPVEGYDGWRGSRDALLSRLLAIDNVAEVTSSGQHHYATVRENLVEMCVNAPGGPPKNSKELLERLMVTNGVLYDLYDGYAEQQSYLETILERPQDALGAYGHYRAFFSKVHSKLDGSWSFDDCDAAYVLLDGLALPEITDGTGRFLLADFVNYATRKDWDKRVMFIFDEIGSLNVPLYGIFEKVRFRQVSVVVSSQDPSGLARKPGGIGTWDEVRRVLGNSAIKIVHHCEDAHEVIKRAGTVSVPDEDYRTDAFGTTSGAGTLRFREELKIHHNDVLQLKQGDTFVIGPGEYERVRVAMHNVDETRWKALYKELERKSKEESPPLPRQGRGGPTIVDSTLAAGAKNGSTSGASTSGSSSSRQNGKQQNGGFPSPSVSPPKKKQQGQNGIRSKAAPSAPPPAQKQPGQPAAPPVSPGKASDVDETLPFALPEVDASPPTQPGILPMWNEKDEDLLP